MNPETLRLGASKNLIEAGEEIKIIAIVQGEHGERIQGATVDIYDDDEATRTLNGINPDTVNIRLSLNDGIDPVQRANVSIGDSSSTTGTKGGCTLQDVPVGTQTVEVTTEGLEEYSETIEVSPEDTEFEITLPEE